MERPPASPSRTWSRSPFPMFNYPGRVFPRQSCLPLYLRGSHLPRLLSLVALPLGRSVSGEEGTIHRGEKGGTTPVERKAQPTKEGTSREGRYGLQCEEGSGDHVRRKVRLMRISRKVRLVREGAPHGGDKERTTRKVINQEGTTRM